MLYQSKDLSEEEIFFVQKHLDNSIELSYTAVAQVYVYDRINTWAHVSTGVLYLGRTIPGNFLTMGLFHLVKMIVNWEEDVYQGMTFSCFEKPFLISEGKKLVFLLNFMCNDDRDAFLKLFHLFYSKDHKKFYEKEDENEYEKVDEKTDDEEHVYEDVSVTLRRKETPKEAKKRLKLQKEHEKAEKKRLAKEEKARKKLEKEKKRKGKEERELVITPPDPNSFEHKCHVGFDSNKKFVIEGMTIEEIQEFLKGAGKSFDSQKQKDTDKDKETKTASTVASAKRYITEFPPDNPPRRAVESRSTEVVMQTSSNRAPPVPPMPKEEVLSKPTSYPKPQMSQKPVPKTKPVPMPKPGIQPKPGGLVSPMLAKKEEATSVSSWSRSAPPVPKTPMQPMKASVVSQNTSKTSNSTDPQSELLSAIRGGFKLRSVCRPDEDPKRSSNTSQRQETGITRALQQSVILQKFNVDTEPEEDNTYFPGDAFE